MIYVYTFSHYILQNCVLQLPFISERDQSSDGIALKTVNKHIVSERHVQCTTY